jgi:phosphate-selective porin OprO/OprP
MVKLLVQLKKPQIKEKDGAFSLSTADGKNSIQLTGRVHFDAKYNNVDPSNLFTSTSTISNNDTDSKSMGSHFNMRRARLGVKGRVGGVADYEIVGNFAGTPGIDVAFVDVNKYEPLGFMFGKFKVAPNLEIKTSSNNIDMIERSYISQNVPEKRFGAALHGEVKGVTYFGSVFQNNDSALSMEDHKLATAGRATINFAEFMENKDVILHAGLNGYSFNYQLLGTVTNNQNSGDLQTRATLFGFQSGGQGVSNAYRAQINDVTLNTVSICTPVTGATNTCTASAPTNTWGSPSSNAMNAHADNVGLEGILGYKNVKLQGEYSSAFYKAVNNSGSDSISADVDTWYAEALWNITGEHYSDFYKKGAMGALKPKENFDLETGKGIGLWELGFRVDAFDVGNTSLTSGSGSRSTRFQGTTNNNITGANSGTGDTCSAAGGGGLSTVGSTNGKGCGGGAVSYTASLKWVWNPNLLWKLNYTRTDFDNGFAPIDIGSSNDRKTGVKLIDHEDLLMLRGQFMF